MLIAHVLVGSIRIFSGHPEKLSMAALQKVSGDLFKDPGFTIQNKGSCMLM